MADEAVHIGPSVATQSYLNVDAILDAISLTGAQAVSALHGFNFTQIKQSVCWSGNQTQQGQGIDCITKYGCGDIVGRLWVGPNGPGQWALIQTQSELPGCKSRCSHFILG